MFWRARTLLKSILFLFESRSLKTFISVRTWEVMWSAGKGEPLFTGSWACRLPELGKPV